MTDMTEYFIDKELINGFVRWLFAVESGGKHADDDADMMHAEEIILNWFKKHDAKVGAEAIREAASAMPVYGAKGDPKEFDTAGEGDVRDYLDEYAGYVELSGDPDRMPRRLPSRDRRAEIVAQYQEILNSLPEEDDD